MSDKISVIGIEVEQTEPETSLYSILDCIVRNIEPERVLGILERLEVRIRALRPEVVSRVAARRTERSVTVAPVDLSVTTLKPEIDALVIPTLPNAALIREALYIRCSILISKSLPKGKILDILKTHFVPLVRYTDSEIRAIIAQDHESVQQTVSNPKPK